MVIWEEGLEKSFIPKTSNYTTAAQGGGGGGGGKLRTGFKDCNSRPKNLESQINVEKKLLSQRRIRGQEFPENVSR